MGGTPQPQFRELTEEEADALLRKHHVGRIAYAWRNQIEIEPIHYVYDGGAIYARTSPGAKLLVLRHSPWVAFEVDEADGLYDWRSVVVHGTLYVARPGGTAADQQTFERAVAALRTLEPAALTDRDPVPGRQVVLHLRVDHLTGRAATPAGT